MRAVGRDGDPLFDRGPLMTTKYAPECFDQLQQIWRECDRDVETKPRQWGTPNEGRLAIKYEYDDFYVAADLATARKSAVRLAAMCLRFLIEIRAMKT